MNPEQQKIETVVTILAGYCGHLLSQFPHHDRADMVDLLYQRLDAGAWIPVDRTSPPANCRILAYSGHYDTPVFQAEFDPDFPPAGAWWDTTTHVWLEPQTHPVTHWRPLPPGPKSEKDPSLQS